MKPRVLRCAIEDLSAWHPYLYVEPYAVAFVAVTGQYSVSPASFLVECEGVKSRWLGKARTLTLEISWTEETIDKAERLRATMPVRSLVELAAIAVALLLVHRVVPLGTLNVIENGGRADYRSSLIRRVLEVSGTENLAELGRRQREKVAQALANPFRWDAYVIVCVPFARKDIALPFRDIAGRNPSMPKRNAGLYPPPIQDLIAEKSAVLSKAQAFADLGMGDMARTLWASAAGHEERLAPLLEALGHDLEAAVHRISGAGCHRNAGNLTAAVNLYRGALAGPLLEHTRQEVAQRLAECLAELSRATFRSTARGRREQPRTKV